MVINTEIVERSGLSVSNMAKYLCTHGWEELPSENKNLIVFQGIDDDFGKPLMLILPRHGTSVSINALRYLAQALEMVAFLENKSLENMLFQIQSFTDNQSSISYKKVIIESKQL